VKEAVMMAAGDEAPKARALLGRGTRGGIAGIRYSEAIVSVVVLVAAITAWQWGPGLLKIPPYIFPPFSAVLLDFEQLFLEQQLLLHTAVTAASVVAGFTIGSLLGMLAGYTLGLSRMAEVVLSPYILALQIAPKVAFAPLFIMWFGYTLYPRILVAVLIVFFPVAVNVLMALKNIDVDYIKLATSLHSSKQDIFWKIQFPASLPELFAGLRIGATLAVIGVIVGEMVGGNLGLGYLLIYGQGQADTATVFDVIVVLTLIGIVAYSSVVLLERVVLKWRPKLTGTA
jgi:NitT/TauT family transport system permease protein